MTLHVPRIRTTQVAMADVHADSNSSFPNNNAPLTAFVEMSGAVSDNGTTGSVSLTVGAPRDRHTRLPGRGYHHRKFELPTKPERRSTSLARPDRHAEFQSVGDLAVSDINLVAIAVRPHSFDQS